ncbi:MAG: hypothetical protein IPH13_05970 [Planctomycetes bacterium]|nr:hypothetical protein [Planctomycetota bacterium]
MLGSVVALALLSPQAVEDLGARTRAIAESSKAVVERMGTSVEGRPIHVLRYGVDPATSPAAKAVLVVAGIDGRATFSVDAAFALCERIGAKAGETLARSTLYVVPCLNPDARVRVLGGAARTDFGGAIGAFDDDHDGRVDEDGPRDVNGDGRIGWMRVFDPPRDVPRTHVVGKDDPRTHHVAEAGKGEVAQFALVIEGMDGDGDGRVAEDGIDGVDLDRNFPHLWKEHARTSGAYPLSAPETNALVRWMLAHEEIASVLVYGTGDTLVNVPEAGRTDVTKQAPLGIETDDKVWHDAIADKFKELTGQKKAPKKDLSGSFVAWAYAQYGVPAFETPIFVAPADPKSAAADGEGGKDGKDGTEGADGKDAKGATEPGPGDGPGAGPGGGPGGGPGAGPGAGPGRGPGRRGGRGPGGGAGPGGGDAGKPAESEAEEKAWIEYAIAQSSFTPWTAFTHPQLGRVEIGGFAPGARLVPPAAERDALIDPQVAFVAALLEKLPRLEVAAAKVEQVDAAVWRVTATVTNHGFLPTTNAIGLKVRRQLPVVFRLDVADDALLSGSRVQRVDTIAGSGGEARATWLVVGASGSTLKLTIRPQTQAAITHDVRLTEAGR